ncbi:MAG: hypothetical protein H7Z43_13980 [Clostridia bacterium]|nr:hypothetical protein [Deltaproteobacteria bacterium]
MLRPTYAKTNSDFDLDSVKLLIGFVGRAVLRHLRLSIVVFVGTIALTVVALMFMPPLYRVQSRILTHTNYIIPALATPGRSVPWQAQSSTDGAVEIIKARDNLRGIIDEANLAATWKETRTPLGKISDRVRGEMTSEDQELALISLLDDRFSAVIEDEKVIVMTIEWHDPAVAVRILETAQKRFLENRKNRELSEINETVTILAHQVEESAPGLELAAERIRTVAQKSGMRVAPTEVAPPPIASSDRKPGPSAGRSPAEVAAQRDAEEALRDQRTAIADIERSYSERVRGAQEHLSKLRGTLGPNHPDVVNATRNVELQSKPPEELSSMKTEESRLATQLSRMQTVANQTVAGNGERVERPPVISRPVVSLSTDRAPNPELEQAMSDYERLDRTQVELYRRLEDAKMEVQTATAGFNYRYLVTQPPVFPHKTVKPKKPVIVLSGIFMACVQALVLAVIADILSGRIVEPWQVTRFVRIPVLGEIADQPRKS